MKVCLGLESEVDFTGRAVEIEYSLKISRS